MLSLIQTYGEIKKRARVTVAENVASTTLFCVSCRCGARRYQKTLAKLNHHDGALHACEDTDPAVVALAATRAVVGVGEAMYMTVSPNMIVDVYGPASADPQCPSFTSLVI